MLEKGTPESVGLLAEGVIAPGGPPVGRLPQRSLGESSGVDLSVGRFAVKLSSWFLVGGSFFEAVYTANS